MTTQSARDLLDKELFVNRGVVTFRSLSRELGIHVNDAKNQLQVYHDAVRDTDMRAIPTYLVSGEVPALKLKLHSDPETQRSDTRMNADSDADMDVDLDFDEVLEEVDVVYQTKVLLVDASVLDETISQFTRIHSVHIYSLSPSRLTDAGLVCTPTFKVQAADVQGGQASFATVGKVTGPHVKLRAGVVNQDAASSSKTTLDVPPKALPKTAVPAKAAQQTTKGKAPAAEKREQVSTTITTTKILPKAESIEGSKSGKLNWSKTKIKDKEQVPRKAKEEKNTDMSEPISTKAKPSAPVGPSVKKGVVYSDEDEDEDEDAKVHKLGQRRRSRKSKFMSDSETSLRAMMDIDDERVECVSRVGRVLPPRRNQSEESEDDGDNTTEKSATVPPVTSEGEASDDEPILPKKKTQRKPRKVIPVGRNGLKKRRVVKSRTTTDAKGYIQTEDYSSYESVGEEEEEESKPKGKAKAKAKAKARETSDKVSGSKAEEAEPKAAAVVKDEPGTGKLKGKPAPKPRGGAPSKRGGLLNFFGPERKK